MFDFTSRYYSIETTTLTEADGRVIAYVRRRFLPPLDSMQLLTDVTVVQGDRLDIITGRTLGAPEQFWWVCDANSSMNPFDLAAQMGRTVHIPMPQART